MGGAYRLYREWRKKVLIFSYYYDSCLFDGDDKYIQETKERKKKEVEVYYTDKLLSSLER
jgi:hypothetical protein